ncbi:MAG: hypothetical protein JXA82_05885 [Sedimentisphaerales bacterium]|nr:hypothetical protein [Sedimentisphaerales bacterium]
MFSNRFRTAILSVLLITITLGTTIAQVGSQDIGRKTMEMFRQKQTGQTELKARHEPAKGAPRRIWQVERDRQLQKEQPAQLVMEPIPPKPVEPNTMIIPPVKADTGLPMVEPIEVTPLTEQPVPTATVGSAPEVLSLVPAESLFCVKIHNFDYAMGQLDSYLKGIIPIPMGLTLTVRGLAGGALGDPMLTNIQTNGDLAVFAVMAQAPGTQMQVPQIAVLTPLTDFEQFASQNPNVGAPDPANIYRIKIPNSLVAELVCTPVAKGKYGLFSAVDTGTQLESILPLMQGQTIPNTLSPDLQKQLQEAPFWAYVNTGQVSQLVSTLSQAQQAQGQGSGQMQMVLQQSQGLVDFLSQLQWLTLALEPSAQMLNAHICMETIPDSDLSKGINKNMFNLQAGPNAPPETAQLITLLKQMKETAQTAPAAQALQTADTADFVGAFNILELIGTIATIGMQQAQNQDPQQQQAMMSAMMMVGMLSQMGQQLKTKMAVAITVQNNTMNYEFAIPKDHLVELINLFKTLNPQGGGVPNAGMMPPGTMP